MFFRDRIEAHFKIRNPKWTGPPYVGCYDFSNRAWPAENCLHPLADLLHLNAMEPLNAEEIRRAVRVALEEDIGSGDVTTLATVPENATAGAAMVAREGLVLAGIGLAEAAFAELSPAVQTKRLLSDGERAAAGAKLLQVLGPARAILTAERAALNFVQRLSGIATLTADFVQAIKGTPAKILDTRKTTPG